MQATVVVQTGPQAGKKLVLQPGQKALVGRASWADLSVPDDREMSGRHFTVECEETRCMLRDFRGSNGTTLNGGKVDEVVLREGDRIVAGQTTFAVTFGDALAIQPASPPVALPAIPPPVLTAGPHDLLELLRGPAQPLFALLDAARTPRVLELLRAGKEEYQSLYEGKQGEELAEWAPYLVNLPPQSPLLESLVREGWGQSWGLYVTCGKPFDEVRKHFRHFLIVKLEVGKEVYFRFYDPRVLRGYLPTCDRLETKEFFGPIEAFWIEDKDPDQVLKFKPGRPQVEQETLALLPHSSLS